MRVFSFKGKLWTKSKQNMDAVGGLCYSYDLIKINVKNPDIICFFMNCKGLKPEILSISKYFVRKYVGLSV